MTDGRYCLQQTQLHSLLTPLNHLRGSPFTLIAGKLAYFGTLHSFNPKSNYSELN